MESFYRSITELNDGGVTPVLLTDIDDTLTDEGRLGAPAYSALWRLHEAGIPVVPVTGRPAGWCDCIVREWPVAGVVGENGAFAMYLEDGRRRFEYHPEVDPAASDRLAVLRERVLSEVPESRVAADQTFRLFDLAIDFAEDEPELGLDVAYRIRDICIAEGAEARVSSIHVNAWFGSYNKLSMSIRFLREILDIDEESARKRGVFVGDSPNDEPMFAHFHRSVAVASIGRFRDVLSSHPRFVSDAPGGMGFSEVVKTLLI